MKLKINNNLIPKTKSVTTFINSHEDSLPCNKSINVSLQQGTNCCNRIKSSWPKQQQFSSAV